jgi:hypothetical protein
VPFPERPVRRGTAITTPTDAFITETQGSGTAASAGTSVVAITTCNGANQSFSVTITGLIPGDPASSFLQTNLVSDVPATSVPTDPNLVNAWGMSTVGSFCTSACPT